MKLASQRIAAFLTAIFVLPLLLLGVAGHASIVMAQSPGTFTPTGNMTTGRLWHTATLLADGRVLIAGGFGIDGGLASAELYDPDTGTFAATGNMATRREWHTATLLPDGRVLIAGGASCATACVPADHSLASAELYDPSTGTFTATGNMITAQSGHRATWLGNGKVLIVGGFSSTRSPYFADPELYDPSTGMFAAAGTYASANPGGNGYGDILATTTTLLADGRVLVLWGSNPAELYDPGADTFSPTGTSLEMFGRDGLITATLLMNGKVLVAGGSDAERSDPGAETYDPSTGTFTATGNMTPSRYLQTATLLPDGTVLIVGGISYEVPAVLTRGELYNPLTNTFRSAGDMASGRAGHTATLLNNGAVLIAGGYSPPSNSNSASAELYIPTVSAPVPIVKTFRFDRSVAVAGASYSVDVLGSNLTSQMFLDVRFTSPGTNESAVVLNWQRGLAASHDIPAGIAPGKWTIIGVRAHEIETDHTGSFVPVSATITVSP